MIDTTAGKLATAYAKLNEFKMSDGYPSYVVLCIFSIWRLERLRIGTSTHHNNDYSRAAVYKRLGLFIPYSEADIIRTDPNESQSAELTILNKTKLEEMRKSLKYETLDDVNAFSRPTINLMTAPPAESVYAGGGIRAAMLARLPETDVLRSTYNRFIEKEWDVFVELADSNAGLPPNDMAMLDYFKMRLDGIKTACEDFLASSASDADKNKIREMCPALIDAKLSDINDYVQAINSYYNGAPSSAPPPPPSAPPPSASSDLNDARAMVNQYERVFKKNFLATTAMGYRRAGPPANFLDMLNGLKTQIVEFRRQFAVINISADINDVIKSVYPHTLDTDIGHIDDLIKTHLPPSAPTSSLPPASAGFMGGTATLVRTAVSGIAAGFMSGVSAGVSAASSTLMGVAPGAAPMAEHRYVAKLIEPASAPPQCRAVVVYMETLVKASIVV
jgi:hypothetical protein